MPIIVGTSGPDTLDGTSGDDYIRGFEDDDTLNGLAGNDYLDGGAGNDIMNGGADDDVYIVDALGDVVNESAGQGFDIVYAIASYVLATGVQVERLSSTDHLSTVAKDLTGNDYVTDIYGNNGANVLTGGAANNLLLGFGGADTLNGLGGQDALLGMDGDDILNGGAGNDYFEGGAGTDILNGGDDDDLYIVDSSDSVGELTGEGFDTIYATTSYVLAAGAAVERLSSTDHGATTAKDLTGNDLVTDIYGNNGVNVLTGGAADNIILGFGDADTLNGLGGQDALFGMDGADTLNGGADDDFLDGGAGRDILRGGAGDDIYIVDGSFADGVLNDEVVELAGEGNDSVYAIGNFWQYTGSAFYELLSSANSASTEAQDLTGNDTVVDIYGNNGRNTLIGGAANNTMLGLDGNDVIRSLGGNDVLDGGAGIDLLLGGDGNDLYRVDDSGDVILEAPNAQIPAAGNDIVYTSADYRVNDDIEALVTANSAGTAGLRLFGSVYNNAITGNAGDNVLDTGQGGTDTLTGLGGADIFSFRNMSFAPTGNGSMPLGVATITDFQPGVDKIRLDLTKFVALTAASTGFFEVGTTATSASTRILYDPATGNLLYDVDGNAAGANADPGKLFGRLQTGLSLTAADFILQANQAPEAHDETYAVNVGATDTVFDIYPQQNDFDLDGLRLWVTRVGVGSGPLVDIGVGQDRTFVGGVYGTLQSHGNKSNFFDYRLDVDDPDTLAIAPGTTVFETYTYEVTDGMREGTLVGTLADFALFDQATITIAITRTASGAIMSTISASDALAPPAAPADDHAGFARAADTAFGDEGVAAVPDVRAALDYLAPDLWVV